MTFHNCCLVSCSQIYNLKSIPLHLSCQNKNKNNPSTLDEPDENLYSATVHAMLYAMSSSFYYISSTKPQIKQTTPYTLQTRSKQPLFGYCASYAMSSSFYSQLNQTLDQTNNPLHFTNQIKTCFYFATVHAMLHAMSSSFYSLSSTESLRRMDGRTNKRSQAVLYQEVFGVEKKTRENPTGEKARPGQAALPVCWVKL